MPDANIPDNQEPKVVTVDESKYNEIVTQLATKTQNEANLVSELKELREKKQEAERVARELAEKNAARPENQLDTREIVKATLQEELARRSQVEAEANRTSAINEFKGSHPEFHGDNDPGGIKYEQFEKTLGRFNTSGLATRDEFAIVLSDAYRLMTGKTSQSESSTQNYSDPSTSAPQPRAVDNTNLSEAELKIVRTSYNGDKDKYLAMKKKRPDYIATLLRYSI